MIGGVTHYLPTFTKRWPFLSADELLWAPCAEPDNPLDPGGYFGQHLLEGYAKSLIEGGGTKTPAEYSEVALASHFIGSVVGGITDQIAARDYKLVEQSRHLLVIRPAYGGHFSDGVRLEIQHHCLLCARPGHGRGKVCIVTTAEDESAWRRNQVVSWGVKHYQITDVEAFRRAIAEIDISATELQLVSEVEKIVQRLQPSQSQEGSNPLAPARAATVRIKQMVLAKELSEQLLPPYKQLAREAKSQFGVDVPLAVKFCTEWPDDAMLDGIVSEFSA